MHRVPRKQLHSDFVRAVRHSGRSIITLAALAGFSVYTVSEVLKLEWRQVDMKAGEVRLDPGTTKNREGRVFPFTAELRELFKALHGEHAVLTKKGTSGAAAQALGNRVQEGRVSGRLFHDLRRSAARNFVRSGIPERVAMRLLGHQTRSIFDRYNIVSSGDFLDAARKLDAGLYGSRSKSSTMSPSTTTNFLGEP
jgi:integrase